MTSTITASPAGIDIDEEFEPPESARGRVSRPRANAARRSRPSTDVRIARELTAGHCLQVALIAVLALLSVAATLAMPLVVSRLVAAVQNGEAVSGTAVALVAAGLAAACGAALATYLLSRLGQGLVFSLRARTMAHSLRLRLTDVRREGSANLATRLTADALQLKGSIDAIPIQLPIALLTLAGTLVIMGLLDWVLLLITMAGFSIAIGLIAAVTIGLRRSYRAVQSDLGALTQDFVSALESLTVIKTCRAENEVSAALRERATNIRQLGNRAARMESLMMPAVNFGQQIALLAVLVGGGARLVNGHLDLAAFVAFLLYLLQLTAPLIMAASGASAIQAGLVARQRFNDVFRLPTEDDTDRPDPRQATAEPEPPVTAEPAQADDAAPAIRFEAVGHRYSTESLFTGLDLQVPAVGLTAIVGPSGAGKSTILALVEKLIVPQAGRISVFGRDIAALPVAALRSDLALVDQAFTVMAASIRQNLVLGLRSPQPDDRLWGALDRVGLADEVRAPPDGLETVLGRGVDLSGGQRQRLALARALLADARLILLDEPSSQLDSRNERKLCEVVDELASERAVLVVAHRISTVQQADQVILLDRGAVVAKGTHSMLRRDCPEYEELVRFQLLTGASDAEPVAAAPGQPAPAGITGVWT